MVDLYAGHILPGTGYLIYALWWSLTTSIRFARSMNHDGGKNRPSTTSYKTSVAMPALFLPKSVPAFLRHPAFESCFRFTCSLVGLIYHPIDAYIDYTKAVKGDIIPAFSNIGDRWDLIYRVEHHFSLYLAFAIASFIEILIHIGVPMPRKLDRAMLIMSYSFEAFIFSNHFNGRMNHSIDMALHTHLAFAVYGCALFCILEAYDEHQVLFTYGRCLFTALQGSWFFQIAASLYLPFQSISFLRWDVNNLDLVPEVTTYFCIHFFFIFTFLFAQMCIVQVIYRRRLRRRRCLTNGYKYRLRLSSSMSSSSDEAIYQRYHVDA